MSKKSKSFVISLSIDECRRIFQEMKRELGYKVAESDADSIIWNKGAVFGHTDKGTPLNRQGARDLEAYLESIDPSKTKVEIRLQIKIRERELPFYLDRFIESFFKKAAIRLSELGFSASMQEPIIITDEVNNKLEMSVDDSDFIRHVTRCESCGVETDGGNRYEIHYGKKIEDREEWSGIDIKTTKKYQIVGVDEVFLCFQCLMLRMRSQAELAVFGSLFPVTLFGILLGFILIDPSLQKTPAYFSICFGVIVLVSLFVGLINWSNISTYGRLVNNGDQETIKKLVGRNEYLGSRAALNITKEKLINGVYDSFFTTDMLKELFGDKR